MPLTTRNWVGAGDFPLTQLNLGVRTIIMEP